MAWHVARERDDGSRLIYDDATGQFWISTADGETATKHDYREGMRESRYIERLVARRHELGITQDELARKMGVIKNTVERWEMETRVPQVHTLRFVASILMTTPEWLVTGEGDA